MDHCVIVLFCKQSIILIIIIIVGSKLKHRITPENENFIVFVS